VFCSGKFALSNSVIVLFLSIAVSMEINRRHYFWSPLGICQYIESESQNILSWKGPARITESSSWLHKEPPKNQTLWLRVLPRFFLNSSSLGPCHCPGEPVPGPDHPYPNPHPDSPLMQLHAIPFPWVLSLSPERRDQCCLSVPHVRKL